MDDIIMASIVLGAITSIIAFYVLILRPRISRMPRTRSRLAERYGGDPDYKRRLEEDDYDNPYIPNWLEDHPGRYMLVTCIVIIGVILFFGGLVRIPAGHRGVLLSFGKVEDRILQEGANWKIPVWQSVKLMNVQIQKAESTESTASKDLQEVTTTVALNYKLDPFFVNIIFQNLQQDYVNRVIKPNIEESLKSATAQFTAEELITKRATVKSNFDDILEERLRIFHIQVVAVSLTDFQFSESFSAAIEAKVTAEQEALGAKNKLEQVRYEAQQQIIQAEAEKNATIARALGEARKTIIEAESLALAKILDANATAMSIGLITEMMTPEYAQWYHLNQWDGRYPTTMLGDLQDLGVFISTDTDVADIPP